MLTNNRYNSFNNLTVNVSMIDEQIENINNVLSLHYIIQHELFSDVYDFNVAHKPVFIDDAINNCDVYINLTHKNVKDTLFMHQQTKSWCEICINQMNTLQINNYDSVQNEYKNTVNNDYYNALKISTYNNNYLLAHTVNVLSMQINEYKKIIALLNYTIQLQNGFTNIIRMMKKTNNIYAFCKKLLKVYNTVSEYESFIPKYSYYSAYYTHSDCDTFIINFEHLKKLLTSFIAGENENTATHQNITFSAILFTLNCIYYVAGVNAFNFNGYYDSTNKHYCYDESMEYSDKTISTDSTAQKESESTPC